jgi:hypothetical protein
MEVGYGGNASFGAGKAFFFSIYQAFVSLYDFVLACVIFPGA